MWRILLRLLALPVPVHRSNVGAAMLILLGVIALAMMLRG